MEVMTSIELQNEEEGLTAHSGTGMEGSGYVGIELDVEVLLDG